MAAPVTLAPIAMTFEWCGCAEMPRTLADPALTTFLWAALLSYRAGLTASVTPRYWYMAHWLRACWMGMVLRATAPVPLRAVRLQATLTM